MREEWWQRWAHRRASASEAVPRPRDGEEDVAGDALARLRRRCGGRDGYLFERRGARLDLVAWVGDPEPPDALPERLARWAEERGHPAREGAGGAPPSFEVRRALEEGADGELQFAFWSAPSGREPRIRFLATVRGASPLDPPSEALLASVAERLGADETDRRSAASVRP